MRWTDTRKSITYIEKENPNHKCRDNNLHQEKFLKEKMEEGFEIRERLANLKREKQTLDFYNGESGICYNSGERLLKSIDQSDIKSESDFRFTDTKSSRRGDDKTVFITDYYSTEKENNGTGRYNSETAEESGNDTNRTGWEDEREYAFGRKSDEGFYERPEEEMNSDIFWNNDRNSNILSDTLYFAGNLFKMIDNQTRYHRKRIKLSQKEIEKRLAHGQKSDGYEEYQDYYNNQLSM